MRLVVPPIVSSYTAGELRRLEDDLALVDDFSSFEPISDPRDVMLSKDGSTLAGKYVLTSVALSQICRTLCPGLIKVINDLAGLYTGPVRSENPGLALEIYNSMVRNRFELLQDKSLVRNLKSKRIDGIIGAGYRQLSNKEFLDLIEDSATAGSGVLKFGSATRIGRTLVTCYILPKSFTADPEPYTLGLYFSNSEVGDCSVKIGNLVRRDSTGERAVGPVKRGRMIHTGKDFASRVRKSVYTEIANFDRYKVWLAKNLKKTLSELPSYSLGFEGLDDKKAAAKMGELAARLARGGLGSQLAERVLYSALYQGKDPEPAKKYETSIRRAQWGTRTAYDLFVSLIRDAARRNLSVRESEEKVAFDLLMNRSGFIKENKNG